jgi:toxin HigB-1
MIKTFRGAEAEKSFNRKRSKRLPQDVYRRSYRKLRQIHNSTSLVDLKVPPGNRLEALSGDRAGQHSIRVNDQWRICFRWRAGHAYEVEIVDYHR